MHSKSREKYYETGNIRQEQKKKVLDSYVIPVFLYGRKFLQLTKKILDGTEMMFYRMMKKMISKMAQI